jgi:tetratricopeptide (TPR) repeat protein
LDDTNRQEVTRLLKRGLNHYGLGDLEAAIACWERAKNLDPENRAAHDYLETAYEESGRRKKEADAVATEPPTNAGPAPATSPAREAFDDDATPRTYDSSPPLPSGASLPELPVTDTDRPDTKVAGALEAYKAGRLEEAWATLQSVASSEPDRLDVQGYLVMVRSERARQWARDVGDQGRVPTLTRTMQELMNMNLSPDEGFLLSQIDGSLSIEELLNLSNDRVRTLEILAKFLREALID